MLLVIQQQYPSLWPIVGSVPAWDETGCEFDSWQCRILYPMFSVPTITWVPSRFSGSLRTITEWTYLLTSEAQRTLTSCQLSRLFTNLFLVWLNRDRIKCCLTLPLEKKSHGIVPRLTSRLLTDWNISNRPSTRQHTGWLNEDGDTIMQYTMIETRCQKQDNS